MTGDRVVIDNLERLLSYLEELEENLARLRAFLTQGFKTDDQSVGDYDLEAVSLLTRDKSPVGPDDSWAYAYDQDGVILPETGALVEDLARAGRGWHLD